MDGYNNHGCRCAECSAAWATYFGVWKVARGRRLGWCSVDGCDGRQYAKGFCFAHYERQRTGRPLDAPLYRRPGARRFD